jgi:hypothetical protein
VLSRALFSWFSTTPHEGLSSARTPVSTQCAAFESSERAIQPGGREGVVPDRASPRERVARASRRRTHRSTDRHASGAFHASLSGSNARRCLRGPRTARRLARESTAHESARLS